MNLIERESENDNYYYLEGGNIINWISETLYYA